MSVHRGRVGTESWLAWEAPSAGHGVGEGPGLTLSSMCGSQGGCRVIVLSGESVCRYMLVLSSLLTTQPKHF